MCKHKSFINDLIYCRVNLYHFVWLGAVIMAVFLFVYPVKSQTVSTVNAPEETVQDTNIVTELPTTTEPLTTIAVETEEQKAVKVADVFMDEQVTLESLGATRASVLPDSPWYVLKRFGRGLQEAFTFNTVDDAALKHRHANQQLAEIRQMIEEKGVDGVAPDVLAKSMQMFDDKLASVSDTVAKLNQVKNTDPAAVENLLNDVTDKQIKRQKLFDNLSNELLNVKKESDKVAEGEPKVNTILVENMINTMQQANENSLQKATEVLVGVSDKPEDVSQRIAQVLDKQTGSEFKDFKNLAILEFMKKKAPENVQDAIKIAQKITVEKFEARMKDIAPAARAERFQNYVANTNSPEAKLYQLLDEIKKSSNMPADILSKIEEAKEIVVNKFEKKLSTMNDPRLENRYINDFETGDVNGIVTLEEFKNRMKSDSEEFKQIQEKHQEGTAAFKQKFTDVKSQEQIGLFQKLSNEMLANPSPKTFKLLRDLEEEVRSDPTKRDFLDKMGDEMKTRVEEQFRREGNKFAENFSSIDPQDIAVYDTIDFDVRFKEAMVKEGAKKMKDFARDINNPEEFDRFYNRFSNAPNMVINSIKEADSEFQNAMQYKVRKMQEQRANKERDIARAKLDYKEREVNFQLDKLQRQKEDEFWKELNSLPWDKFEERKAVWGQKIEENAKIAEERFNEQKSIFFERLKNDPWCDEVCRQIQEQFMEQEFRHSKERLAEDLTREVNRIESEKVQQEKNNPLAGKCNTPDDCKQFCVNNKNLPECGWMIAEPPLEPPRPNETVVSCAPGFYMDFNTKDCVKDPYFKPPITYRNCAWGAHWDEARGVCQKESIITDCTPWDEARGVCKKDSIVIDCTPKFDANNQAYYSPECNIQNQKFCPPDYRWDDAKRDCARTNLEQCGPGYYFDYFSKSCEQKGQSRCPFGERFDADRQICIRETVSCPAVDMVNCPVGQYRESFPDSRGCWTYGECKQQSFVCPREPFPCPMGQFRESFIASNGCEEFRECRPVINACPELYFKPCPEGSYRDFYTNESGCQMASECRTANIVKPAGYCGDKICGNGESKYTCAEDCGQVQSICGNKTCEFNEDKYNCPMDCGMQEYPGDQNSCPWFAASMWDQDGKRYCKLNTENKCDYNYPSYLIKGDNYKEANCPINQVAQNCYTNTSETLCKSQTGCRWTVSGSASFCETNYYNTACNNNGICESGESTGSCPTDCKSNVATTTPAYYCGDGLCNGAESTDSCSKDCGQKCGVSVCSPGNYCADSSKNWCCPTGQSICADGRCVKDQSECKIGYCGDGQCAGIETRAICPSDCGEVLAACLITFANNYDGSNICNTKNCPQGCVYSKDANNKDLCPIECKISSYCGDNICNNNETTATCPVDCKTSTTTTTPTPTVVACSDSDNSINVMILGKTTDKTGTYTDYCNGDYIVEYFCSGELAKVASADPKGYDCKTYNANYICKDGRCTYPDNYTSGYCGDTVCSGGETAATCASDCGTSGNTTTSGTCGDNVCNSTETYVTCPADCRGGAITTCTSGTIACDYTACPNGCNWDSSGCVSGCKTASSMCTNMTGWHYDSTTNSCVKDGTTCSNPTACSTCSSTSGSTTGSSWCQWDNNGCPTGCQTSGSTSGWCGDNVCGSNETAATCASDCGTSGGGGGTMTTTCATGSKTCDYTACPSGCAWDSNGCTSGCYTSTSGYCGDNVCSSNETAATCASDCGTSGGGGGTMTTTCATGSKTCDYTACPSGCAWDSNGCTSGCYTSTSGYCGDNVCNNGETSATCSSDCTGGTTTTGLLTNGNKVAWKDQSPLYKFISEITSLTKSILRFTVRAFGGF